MTGAVFMLSAALVFSILDILIKALGPSFRVWDIAFFRFTWGMAILVSLFFWRGNPFRGTQYRLLVMRGIIGSIAFLCLIAAIRMIPLGTAMAIFYSFPAFAALFSTFLYKERLTIYQFISIVVVFIGAGVLFGTRFEGELTGQLLSLLGGVLAGLTVCLVRRLRQDNGPVVIYLYFCLAATIVILPGFIADPHMPETVLDWAIAAGIAVSSIGAQLLMNQGYRYCRSWEGGIYLTTEILFTALFASLWFREPLTPRFILAAVLIFCGIVSLNRFPSKA